MSQEQRSVAGGFVSKRNLRRAGALGLGLFVSLGALGDTTSISVGNASVTTGATATTLNFPISRTGDTSYDAYLNYHTVDGTAVSGTDYTGVAAGQIRVPAGTAPVNIPITVAAGTNGGGDKTLQVVLDAATGVGPDISFPASATNVALPAFSNPYFAASGDINNDGRPDLAVANHGTHNISVLLNTTAAGAGTATYASAVNLTAGTNPFAVTIADFNSDGKPDLAVPNYDSDNVSILLSTTAAGASTATFLSPFNMFLTGSSTPLFATTGDFNGDGKPDLAVVLRSIGKIAVLLNTTTAGATSPTFVGMTNFTTGTTPYAAAVGDFNNDGKPDLAVANASGSVSVLLNTAATGASTPAFASAVNFATGTFSAYVAVGDINGDGRADLAVANQQAGTISVLLNTAAAGAAVPAFASAVDFSMAAGSYSVALSDFNGDGKLDLASANYGASNVAIRLNTTANGAAAPAYAAATILNVGATVTPYTVLAGDINGDGKSDIATANTNGNNVTVLLNATSYAASPLSYSSATNFQVGSSPFSVAAVDLNGDGKPDMAATSRTNGTVSVLLNTSTAGAAAPSYAAAVDIAVGSGSPSSLLTNFVNTGDFNGDGKLDLVVTNSGTTTISVLMNGMTAGATTPAFTVTNLNNVGNGPYSIAVGDFNRDGKPDLALANRSGDNVSVLLNKTASGSNFASFAAATYFAANGTPYFVSLADVNADGTPDLVVANWFGNSVSVLLNFTAPGATAPTFAAATNFAVGTHPQFCAVGDFNADGRPDIVASNYDSNSVSVLFNTTAAGAAVASYTSATNIAVGTNPAGVAVGDFNGDGKADIAVPISFGSTVSLLTNNTVAGSTTASFTAAATLTAGANPFYVAVGDFNMDGKADLAAANVNSSNVSVFLNANAQYAASLGTSTATGTIRHSAALTVTRAGNGSGTVTSAPAGINCGVTCSALFADGASVSLSATPAADSTFAGWSGGGCSGTGSCFVTMSQARSVTATFVLKQYAVSLTAGGTGSGVVVSSPAGMNCSTSCSANFNHGTALTLTATPNAGSDFVSWSGCDSVSGNACSIASLTAARAVTVTFNLSTATLTVSRTGAGSGTVSSTPAGVNCGATCSANFVLGTSVTLAATPDAGSVFSGFSGDCSGSSCVLNMSAAHSVSAQFDLADITPNGFSFAPLSGVEPGSLHDSNTIVVGGLNTASPVSVSGGYYALNGGPCTNSAGSVVNGDVVSVCQLASSQYSDSKSTTLTIGADGVLTGESGTFVVSTRAGNPAPADFSFGSKGGAEPSAFVDSDPVIITGNEIPATVTGALHSIGCTGVYTAAQETISSGQSICVRATASSTFEGTVVAVLSIGGKNGTFSVTTRAGNPAPADFSFGSKSGAEPNALVESDPVIITGNEIPADVSGAPHSIGCTGVYTTAPETISSGQSICVSATASSAYSTTFLAQLTIGGKTGSFSVTTRAGNPAPADFFFDNAPGVERSTLQTSKPVLISGNEIPAPVSVSNGSYSIGCTGSFTSASGGTINSGETVCVQHVSAGTFAAPVMTTLYVGGKHADFTSITRAGNPQPADFSFAPAPDVERSTVVTSAAVVISGNEVPALVHVDNGSYSIGCNGSFTSADGPIDSGQSVCVQHTSSSSYSSPMTTTLYVAGKHADFTSITRVNPSPLGAMGTTDVPVTGSNGETDKFSSSGGTIVNLRAVPAPAGAPASVSYPAGFFAFDVVLAPGQTSSVITVEVPAGSADTGLYKCDNSGNCRDVHAVLSTAGGKRTLTYVLVDNSVDDTDPRAGYISDPVAPFFPLPPVVAFSASPAALVLSHSTTLTWASSNADACTAGGAWSGSKPASGSASVTPAAAGSVAYTLSCTGAGGTATQTVTLTVSKAQTRLAVNPFIADLVPGTKTYITLSATLYNASVAPNKPLAGRTVTFTAGNAKCSDVTNADGLASCVTTNTEIGALSGLGYTAAFSGNANYQPSSGSGSLLIVSGTKLPK